MTSILENMYKLFDENEYVIYVSFLKGRKRNDTELNISATSALEAAMKAVEQIQPNRVYYLTVDETRPVNSGSREHLEYRFEK